MVWNIAWTWSSFDTSAWIAMAWMPQRRLISATASSALSGSLT